MLPDSKAIEVSASPEGLNAPAGAWCSLTLNERIPNGVQLSLNAPAGAWCSLTDINEYDVSSFESQCTCRCVVLPDPCLREWRYDGTSRARSAIGPGSTPADRPAPGSD